MANDLFATSYATIPDSVVANGVANDFVCHFICHDSRRRDFTTTFALQISHYKFRTAKGVVKMLQGPNRFGIIDQHHLAFVWGRSRGTRRSGVLLLASPYRPYPPISAR